MHSSERALLNDSIEEKLEFLDTVPYSLESGRKISVKLHDKSGRPLTDEEKREVMRSLFSNVLFALGDHLFDAADPVLLEQYCLSVCTHQEGLPGAVLRRSMIDLMRACSSPEYRHQAMAAQAEISRLADLSRSREFDFQQNAANTTYKPNAGINETVLPFPAGPLP